MLAYLDQLAVSQRPATIQSTDTALRLFASFVLDHDPKLRSARQLQRRHIEAYKTTLTTPREPGGRSLKNNTVRMRLGMLRVFFERIIEWGWDDSPARCPVFVSDLPRVDDPLPRFLDDASAARFMRAAAEQDPLPRLIVEMLARTGMRVGELCALARRRGDDHRGRPLATHPRRQAAPRPAHPPPPRPRRPARRLAGRRSDPTTADC